MKKNIQAAVLEKLNKPLVLKEINCQSLKAGQVLVKIHFSGLCGSQVMEINGGRGKDRWLPHCLGHEGSGEVIAFGKGVTKFKIGDKVILTWLECKGKNASNAQYKTDNIIINSGKVTTFSNYSVVSENRIIKKPPILNMREAVLFGCAIPTGFGMVINEIKPKKNMNILIIGLGGIGISSLLALKCLNHKKVILADIFQSKLNLAKKLGFKNCINLKKVNIAEYIYSNCDGGIDICIESAGLTKTIELGFSLINNNGGKLFFASHPNNRDYIKISPHDLIKGKRIYGSWGGKSQPDKDIPKMANLIKKSQISLSSLISKTYKLKNINDAIKDLQNGREFRPIIKMEH